MHDRFRRWIPQIDFTRHFYRFIFVEFRFLDSFLVLQDNARNTWPPIHSKVSIFGPDAPLIGLKRKKKLITALLRSPLEETVVQHRSTLFVVLTSGHDESKHNEAKEALCSIHTIGLQASCTLC